MVRALRYKKQRNYKAYINKNKSYNAETPLIMVNQGHTQFRSVSQWWIVLSGNHGDKGYNSSWKSIKKSSDSYDTFSRENWSTKTVLNNASLNVLCGCPANIYLRISLNSEAKVSCENHFKLFWCVNVCFI